ncbi:MAG: DUF1512 family protein, partial [Candidatus Aenigmatarchaeota archaeon]
MDILFQFVNTQDSWLSWLFFLIFWGVFFFFYPRLMLSQILWKIERTAEEFEEMAASAKAFIISQISKKPDKKLRDSISNFFEFFVIEPVSLDPYGIVKKLDLIIQHEKQRFHYFVNQIAPDFDSEKKANLEMGLAGGIEMYNIAKIVRHYVELIKETKSYQIALIIQMQLPLIEKIAKAVFEGTKTLAKGEPVGDGIGPLVAASLVGDRKVKEIEEDIVMSEIEIEGRKCFVLKAKGPGGRLGRPGKAVEKIVKQHKISRIITIDAAAKLEGEKTGSIAEGVGVAMGGPGVERSYIEDVAVKYNIPLDSIIIKMKPEEAILPMKKEIKDSLPFVLDRVKDAVRRSKKGEKVIIVGVGNTSGVGNDAKSAKETEKWVDEYDK